MLKSKSSIQFLPNIPNDLIATQDVLSSDFLESMITHRFRLFEQSNIFSICFLGRVSPEKGLLELIKSVSTIAKKSSFKIQFNVMGLASNSTYIQAINSYLADFASDKLMVSFHGLIDRPNLIRYMKNNMISIFPSKGENYCHAIAESLSVAIPVIYSNIPYWRKYRQIEFQGENTLPPILEFDSSQQSIANIIEGYASYSLNEYLTIAFNARSVFDSELKYASSNVQIS